MLSSISITGLKLYDTFSYLVSDVGNASSTGTFPLLSRFMFVPALLLNILNILMYVLICQVTYVDVPATDL